MSEGEKCEDCGFETEDCMCLHIALDHAFQELTKAKLEDNQEGRGE
jgi:DTW domain-containing protein YfiP